MPKDWTEDWDDLKKNYPIDLTDLIKYCEEFETLMSVNLNNIGMAKQRLIQARGKLFLAMNNLYSMFYDRTIFKKTEDLIIFSWLKDDLNRVLAHLESREKESLIDEDSADREKDRVSLSGITAYYTDLITTEEGILYNSLKKAKKEFFESPEEEIIEEKIDNKTAKTIIKKDKRKFLYILFLVVSNSVGIFGGLAKEGKVTKRGIVGSLPTTYQSLMATKGQKFIREAYREDIGKEESSNLDDMGDLLTVETPEEIGDITQEDEY